MQLKQLRAIKMFKTTVTIFTPNESYSFTNPTNYYARKIGINTIGTTMFTGQEAIDKLETMFGDSDTFRSIFISHLTQEAQTLINLVHEIPDKPTEDLVTIRNTIQLTICSTANNLSNGKQL